MANPFTVNVPSVYEALLAGEQGYKGMRDIRTEQALGEAGRRYAASDLQGAQALAAGAGKGGIQFLMNLAQQKNNERDFAFRQTEAERAQRNADRGFGLQERQIAATAGNTAASRALAERQFEFQKEQGNRPEIREETDDNGNKRIVLIDRKTGAKTPVNGGGAQAEPNNPFLSGGPMKEEESKAALYANRMLNVERIFRDPAVLAAGQNKFERAIDKAPFVGSSSRTGLGNYVQGADYQRFDQAKRDFINAVLRRESGAAIAESEFANAERQYFPQPGDSQAVLKQKQANRIEAIKGIGAGAGRGYRPDASFDSLGNIVERGAKQAAGAPAQITSAQQRDALPPGTQYVAPDGSLRTKQ